ncbi:hypothetical protein Mycsm_04953 [Mycobacterium sp. JS623]|uniref:hypothetical protein n=1 Tax=Mycobacterium sp. JS623 TaxID=212767 RepID=UPI0002A5885D|nr:hypothetical protein [Mycobacterium sp. JS623]AGB25168.1 hypothetical protein Mycsm_04953 [Mycobacterium sp. JS623]
MTDIHVVANMTDALLARLHPAITRWNRLEGRPRTHHFDRALRAEVRDAMWMLSRQWQLGEFVGDDAGSPVLARACLDMRLVDRYQAAAGAVLPFDRDDLIEPRVERKPVPMSVGDQYLSLDLRMSVGRRWLRLLERDFPANDYADQYRTAYAVKVPDPTAQSDQLVCAHVDAWQEIGCAAERAIDGVALLDHVASGGSVDDGINLAAPAHAGALDSLLGRLREWFSGLIDQPVPGDDAWSAERLEYAFGISAPSGDGDADGGTEMVLRAPEYHHGTLDWYALEHTDATRLDPGDAAPPLAPTRDVQTFIPTQVVFDGMPDTRWWTFEDRLTNFGDVTPDTTDIGKLLLMEFALIFANDWFVVPWTLPIGALAEMQGIAVTTVFDERLWIEPVPQGVADAGWESWSMFSLTGDSTGHATFPAQLSVLPVASRVLEGPPLEEISLVRDEMSNMVWAIEQQIPLPTGWPRSGVEAGHELHTFLQGLVGPPAAPPPAPAAPIRYTAMTSVPEQWIPFIPVHVPNSTRETQLQRAAMPRFLDNAPPPPRPVEPRTPLLRHNLPDTYFIYEEEVPRAGVHVTQCFQRVRRADGSVVVWYGARKGTGRGEGSSGLGFDRLTATDK